MIANAILMSGLFLMIVMQFVIFGTALKNSPGHAVLCLLVPFYVYVYARKTPSAKKFIYAWYGGLVLIIVGTMMLS